MQPIYPNMTPLSPDHLAASNRSVIISVTGPTQDGSSSRKSNWQTDLQPDQRPFTLHLGSLTLKAVNPTLNPFPTNGSKEPPGSPRACPQWVNVGGGLSSCHAYASCHRTKGVGSLEAGLATIRVIRSGKCPPSPSTPPPNKGKSHNYK